MRCKRRCSPPGRASAGMEERASLRTWLYKIVTNRCLNALRSGRRRAAREWDVPSVEPPESTRLGEVVWLQPYPDDLLDDVAGTPPGPEARYEQAEAISLAFIIALQVLPPRQVAVLILRDVLGFHASEMAVMLDATVEAVNSALKRARASMQRRQEQAAGRRLAPAAGSPAEAAIVARFCASLFGAGRKFDLVAARANGQPASGAYLQAPGVRHGTGLYVLALTGDRICAMVRFEANVLPWFGLPRSLPDR